MTAAQPYSKCRHADARRRIAMLVNELMTTHVATCRESDSLDHAAGLMWENDCGIVPVVSETGQLIGVITDRDALMAAHFEGRPLSQIPIRNAMCRELQVSRAEETIRTAEARMRQAQVRRLPVVDASQRLVGILSLTDIARASDSPRNGDGIPMNEVARTLASIGQPRDESPGSETSQGVIQRWSASDPARLA
jgi:CBS domain-containing protein